MSIAENYRKVEENIQQACREAGRSRDEVRLIAVTKFVDTDRIGEAADAGAKEVGENRPQELVSKLDFFQKRGLCPHMIGQLQTNKVKYVIGKVALIQSVDRPELAKEISRLAQKHGCSQDVLLEVNIGAEEQKGGVMPAALPGFLDMVSQLPGIRSRA